MEELLKELATTGLSKALEYIETAESFVVEQAPLLVQEILMFGLADACLSAFILLVLVVGLGYGTYRVVKLAIKDGADEAAFILGLCGGGGAIGCTIGLFQCVFTIAKITFAPRLYLLQELKALL